MREHQIVVNLKAQQFEQLQKLARERGFKSVSAYVKQKVLELALEKIDSEGGRSDGHGYGHGDGQLSDEQVSLAAAPVLVDLDRIHNELKSFLDELSGPTELPNSALGSSSGLLGSMQGSMQGSMLGMPVASDASSGDFAERKDFAVAAPDDDFDWAPAGGSGFSTAAYTNSLGPGATSGLRSGSSIGNVVGSAASSFDIGTGASAFQDDADTSTLPQVLPSNNLGGFGYGLGKYSSFSGAGYSARFSTPFNVGDRLSGYRDIMDDMEELADRAFAISPRLGALDESVEDEPADDSRGRRKRVENLDAGTNTSTAGQASAFGEAERHSAELDEQAAAELEASAYEESAEDYDSGYDYGEEELKLDLELGVLAPTASALPSFVEPISLDKLLTPEQLEAEDVQAKLNLNAEEKPIEKPRRRSNKLFDEPMLPPPDEIDEAVERKPTFVPPPAPLPPRVSQANIPAMTAEEAAALEKATAQAAAAAIEDDLLSELLDGNLTHQRDQSAPNPFAVSLSFELEATAVATNDVAGPVGMLANELASMEEQTPLGQMAMAAEAALYEAPVAAESESTSTSGYSATADAVSTDFGQESLNPTTFSGTPPPKRRRT